MKINHIISCYFFFLLCICIGGFTTISIAQSKWYKYPGNLVFEGGQNGRYRSKTKKAVVYDNGQYQMWYQTSKKNNVKTLGYATSIDGIIWNRYEGDSINFECVDESWDSGFIDFDIIMTDTAYLIWYSFTEDEYNNTCLGFAWSNDGKKWTKHKKPVLKRGEDDEWDAHGPRSPAVIYDGKLFRLYYSAYDKKRPAIQRTGLATSLDGVRWRKHPSNPILSEGESGSWDDFGVSTYSVIFNGSTYDLWYTGNNLVRTQIGYASSTDGIHWSKSSENPVLKNGRLGEKDSRYISSPEVVFQNTDYRMWYYESDNYRGFQTYATTSADEFLGWDSANIKKPQREIRARVFNRMEYIKVDSLTRILQELSGIDKIDAYNSLAIAYSLNNETKSMFYADKALELSNKINYPHGKAMALYSIGNSQYNMDNYGIALTNYLSSLRIYDSLDMPYEKGDLLLNIATINSQAGSKDLQFSYARQALKVYEQTNDTGSIIFALNYLGYATLNIGDTINAIQTFKRRLKLEEITRNIWALQDNYNALGRCYSGRILDSALYFYNQAILIRDSLNKDPGAMTLINIADAYFAAGSEYYEKAGEYYLKCYTKYWIGSHPGEVYLLNSMAELYLNSGSYDKCREFLEVSLEMCELWLSRLEHQLFYNTGKIYNEHLLKTNREKVYRLYFRLDTILNDEASALKHYMLATQYKDSIYNEQERRHWSLMQGQYETEASQNKITVLESENEIKDLRIQQSRILLFSLGAFVMIIITAAILFIRNRKIRAQQAIEIERLKSEKLKELDHLKSQFFANISHEFRTPLTLIKGPLERVLSRLKDKNDIRELSTAKKYSGNLQNLINNLLSISKLESGKMLLRASETDIVKMVNTYCQSFESLAKQKNIRLKFSSGESEIFVFIDREKIEQVLNNLLSNAFKFTSEGEIKVQVSEVDNTSLNSPPRFRKASAEQRRGVLISVSDTGLGVSLEHINHIFDRFYQIEGSDSNGYQGTGIGLALSKELVELHKGRISVESEPGKGSIFTIILPLGYDHLQAEEIMEDPMGELSHNPVFTHPEEAMKEANSVAESGNDIDNGPPVLLIVEDNADMRSFIGGYFDNNYRIIEAIDGTDGYDKSAKYIPDIIISDVMMPRMDGNEFCRKVKLDERTSHIPVILLTARASKESRIEGLETGADDFITKPFDGDELQVRVENLINQRRRISKLLEKKIEKNHKGIQIDFEDSGITSMDDKFLQKVMKIIKDNYTDPEFNTKAFGQAIGLGRIQLNRKIKALTGQTTTNFIRTYRLNRAAEMIKKKSGTVAEIAYDVGFNSPSYFTECFRLHFGKLPSEFNGDTIND